MAKNENYLFVDAIMIGAEGLNFLPNKPAQASSSSSSSPNTIFGRLTYQDKVRYSTRYQSFCEAPIWNEDCTFTLPEEAIKDESIGLEFCLVERVSGLLSTTFNILGKTYVSFKEKQLQTMIDLTVPLSPPSQGGAGGIGKEGKEATVHLVFFLADKHEEGILSSYGKPMKSIPFRLAPGDLLLLSNNQWSSVGVQFVTWSQWDHVAMVSCLKGRPHALRFFEVTQEGVEIFALDDTLDFYLNHDSVIGVRRLKVTRTPAMIDSLSQFMEETRGRPYKTDYFQLFRSLFQSNEEDDTTSLFCSQLIVAAYQQMGIVKNETLSNNFLPSHFADNISEHLCLGELDKIVNFTSRDM
mmetsp:Transcript_26466/g.41200  ORF Transcript_26466/g.41200 Transcript_26466/m.41200 type:complete len:354 (-) Transcript_26466:61-1122(-)|eukprot:CAMPEP_0201517914 /NCGR_PEP_ID=MMETSP0161_2-20130828/8893_1 /ASSEMBLY_ACC=CAM_ASM_000251 /TAXON_ID=180227 /ORGANISM="Neoparamoeba aestuarina, Strain SoJaBio B1-5/56/2" /LENGTH=353 /DNA_ID=CAMNT_0047915543 /DNA_START=110 /DNA_END=1171 /DNA_ORIENTATION=-